MSRDPQGCPAAAALHLPAADEAAKQMVHEALGGMGDALPELGVTIDARFVREASLLDVPSHGEALALSIPLIETCLDLDPKAVQPPLLAQLVLLSLFPGLPEQMALQIAFGWDLAEEHVHQLARIIGRATRRGVTVDEYVAQLVATGSVPETRATRCFRGETRWEPDGSRAARGAALFRTAAAHVPEGLRPSLLCVVAWLFWATGKRPHAMAHLVEASRIEPTHVLAYGLIAHLAANSPAWLRNGRDGRQA
jgi:hypothetical protein